MPTIPKGTKIVPFSEHPVLDLASVESGKFDVTSKGLNIPSTFLVKGQFLIEYYCYALLEIIFTIAKSNLIDFIDYQCSLLKSPVDWLDSLEILIEENCEQFDSPKEKFRIQQLIVCISDKRNELNHKKSKIKPQLVDFESINEYDNKAKFDFKKVILDLSNFSSYEDKKAYSIGRKADYLEDESLSVVKNEKTFDSLVDIELERLERLDNLKNYQTQKHNTSGNKIRINGPLNVLVEVYYQMLYEYKINNKPYLQSNQTEVATHIVTNFLDRDGCEISLSTVRTMLSPGKADKRPNNDKRINLC